MDGRVGFNVCSGSGPAWTPERNEVLLRAQFRGRVDWSDTATLGSFILVVQGEPCLAVNSK